MSESNLLIIEKESFSRKEGENFEKCSILCGNSFWRRFDAVTLNPIESYREQIGAWWLGLPIFTLLLVIPGLLLSWFPRMLPSEVIK